MAEVNNFVIVVCAGYSLGKELDTLIDIKKKNEEIIIISIDVIYTYLLKKGIISTYVINSDWTDGVIESMENIHPIIPHDSVLVSSNLGGNLKLWNMWDKSKRVNVGMFPGRISVSTPAISLGLRRHMDKKVVVLGQDLCWLESDKFYVDSLNKEQAAKNIEYDEPYQIIDIFGNEVFTNDRFVDTNKWLEGMAKLYPNRLINATQGPSIFGKNNDNILKTNLDTILNKEVIM